MEGLRNVKRRSLQPYLWMLASSVAFSWMAILTNLAADAWPWQVIALVRSLVPLLLLAVWARIDGIRIVFWGPRILWVRSIAGSISLVGSFYALTHLAPSEVYTIMSMFPIWVALLSWPMLGEVPSAAVWLSVVSGVAGVALVQRPDVEGINPTALLVVGVSVFTALAMMGLHRLKALDARAVVVHFSGVSAVFCLLTLVLFPLTAPPLAAGPRHLWLLGGVGVTATIGQLFLTKAFTTGSPAGVSVVSLTQVVFVLALDVGLLGHGTDAVKLLGVVLILAPTAWLLLRPARRQRPAPRPLEPTVSCE